MFQEIRHALRLLARNPGFAAIAIVSLALGIGANSAIFSLADALLLRPLPVKDSGAVLTISAVTPEQTQGSLSYREYRDLRDKTRSFDGMLAYQFTTVGLATSPVAQPQMRAGMLTSENLFRVLGVEAETGRTYAADEGVVPGKDAVVVLGYDFWKDQFGADKSVVGRTLRINGVDFAVIGVLPKSFTGMDQYFRPAFYAPASMMQRVGDQKQNPLEDRSNRGFSVKARLKGGVDIRTAKAELASLAANLEQQFPETNRRRSFVARTELDARLAQPSGDAMLVAMLMTLVGLVLLIACANVANLLLARASGRTREIAIRLAIGAGRVRLMRQLLIESLVLSLAGCVLSFGVAYAGIRLLQTFTIPTDLPIVLHPELDGRVMLFSLGASLVAALLFGLVPAWQTASPSLVPALKSATAGSTAKSRTIGRSLLVVSEVALAMVLLMSASMMFEGFRKALLADPGFRTDHRLMMEFDPSLAHYTAEQSAAFYRQLRDRSAALPGIRQVALSNVIPFAPNQHEESVAPEGYQFTKGREKAGLFANIVDEHYFDTIGTHILRGRAFTAADTAGAPHVAIVNEEFARTYWPKQDALGKRIRLPEHDNDWAVVVGIAATGKYLFIAEGPTPFLYLPYAQYPRMSMSLIAETNGDPAPSIGQIREVVHSLDANLPIYNTRTFSSYFEKRAMAAPKLILQLVGSMGGIGLAIALVGLYGLIAYTVSRRTREIGIRVAIGASGGSVLRMVLRQGMILAGSGLVVGIALSVLVGKGLAAGLAGLGSPSLVTYVAVPVSLVLVTMLACFVPAWRASRIDPLVALRYE